MRTEGRPSSTRVVVILGLAVIVLSVVFGVATVRSRNAYDDFRERSLGTVPWESAALEVGACVEFAVAWGMTCPSNETWCLNGMPDILRACLGSAPRQRDCDEIVDRRGATSFGVSECEALRRDIDGRHAQRGHKKFCAAAYRTLAAYCDDLDASPRD